MKMRVALACLAVLMLPGALAGQRRSSIPLDFGDHSKHEHKPCPRCVIKGSLPKASDDWRNGGGKAPRCDNPSSTWGGRQLDLLNLMSENDEGLAQYPVEVRPNDPTEPDETRIKMDNLKAINFPFILPPYSNWPSPPYRATAKPGPNWGIHWDMADPDLPWLLSAAAFLGGGAKFDKDLKKKYSSLFCMDATGNFHATTMRDHRREISPRLLVSDKYRWKGAEAEQVLIPRPLGTSFPVGEVLIRPGDQAKASAFADSLYFSTRDKPSNDWLPALTRWDIVLVPIIEKEPYLIFDTPEDFQLYIHFKDAKYVAAPVFRTRFVGKIRKQDYVDGRFGSQMGKDRGAGGPAQEAYITGSRGLRFDGTDPFTQGLVASVAGGGWATTADFGTYIAGNVSIAGLNDIKDFVHYDNEEHQGKIREGCRRKNGFSCDNDENILLKDKVAPDSKGMCPAGYTRAVVAATTPMDWNRSSSAWTKENYDRVANCPNGKCENQTVTFDTKTQYECRLMSEHERNQGAGGNRSGVQTQSREDRIQCRRTGTCTGNNNSGS